MWKISWTTEPSTLRENQKIVQQFMAHEINLWENFYATHSKVTIFFCVWLFSFSSIIFLCTLQWIIYDVFFSLPVMIKDFFFSIFLFQFIWIKFMEKRRILLTHIFSWSIHELDWNLPSLFFWVGSPTRDCKKKKIITYFLTIPF